MAITGGTGFVGSTVIEAAQRQGIAIRSLARRVPAEPQIDWIAGDLADPAALVRLCDGASALIHIAALTNAPDPADFEAANVDGTAAVIKACKSAGLQRLVFVSSLAARKPELSRYGASKARAEELVMASGLDWTIVRPPAVYGPRDIDMFDLFRAAKWGVVPLPPGGATSVIHADDLAELLLAVAVHGAPTRKQIYEPDDGREGGWSHKELAAAIGAAVGRKVFAPHLPEGVLNLAARADRMLRGDKAKLTADRVGYMCHPNWVSRGDRKPPAAIWQPRIATFDGLAATAKWYREKGWL